MAQRRHVFTRMGRPPTIRKTPAGGGAAPDEAPSTPSPMDGFQGGIPGAAFRRGGSVNGCEQMPRYHPDKGFCGGGKVK